MSRVDIGFSEECEPWRLESPQFPSKIGGKPAWLSYNNLPKEEDLKCEQCAKPKTFLCQVYAPYEECNQNFHRTIYIFACKTPSCNRKNDNTNFAAFRDNLPRKNAFYSAEPPKEDAPVNFNPAIWTKLCALCGCFADKSCSKCKTTTYCTREHQVLHWKETHRIACTVNDNYSANKKQNATDVVSVHLFPQFELVTEPEELDAKQEVDVEAQLKEYEALQSSGKAGTLDSVDESDLDQHAAVDGDKTFTHFRKRVECNPDQVLRYERAGQPLWIAKEPVPKDDGIPKCEYCNSERRFEFQVMPQMLAVLNEDKLDFGVLAVYTCTDSCWDGEGYKKEFLFKQDVSD